MAFAVENDDEKSMSSTMRSSSSIASRCSKSFSSLSLLAVLLARLRSISGSSQQKLVVVGVRAIGVPGCAPRLKPVVLGEDDTAGQYMTWES